MTKIKKFPNKQSMLTEILSNEYIALQEQSPAAARQYAQYVQFNMIVICQSKHFERGATGTH